MLIELGQLICSAGISDVYKPVKQGKELQEWVNNNRSWVYYYYSTLFRWAIHNIKMKDKTYTNMLNIWSNLGFFDEIKPTHAYFRYAKEYKCSIPSKTLLPIDQCITEYKKYLKWKIKR